MSVVSKLSKGKGHEVETNIDAALSELIDQLPGVSAAMLFDTDGFALSDVIRPGGEVEVESAEAAAMGAGLISAARQALAAGSGSGSDDPVRSIWVRNDRQNLYCVGVGEAAYAVVTAEPDVPAGLLMFRIDKWAKLATKAIESLSLTIPEQLVGSASERDDRKLLAVEVPADRIGPARVGVPEDLQARDEEPFDDVAISTDSADSPRSALYSQGAGLAEAIGIELIAEVEEDQGDDEALAVADAPASAADPAAGLTSDLATGFAPESMPEPAADATPDAWEPPAVVAPPSVVPALTVVDAAAEAPAAPEIALTPVDAKQAGPFDSSAVPTPPALSDDWVIMETAAVPTPTVAPAAPAAPAAPTAPAPAAPAPAPAAAEAAPAPAPIALADAMGEWLAPPAAAQAGVDAPAPAVTAPLAPPTSMPAPMQAPAAAASSPEPSHPAARPPVGPPVSFEAPPAGYAPIPPAWMAPAPVAAAQVAAPPRFAAPPPMGQPVGYAPPAAGAAPLPAHMNAGYAPAPTGSPMAFPAPTSAPAPAHLNAGYAPAPTGSPIALAPPLAAAAPAGGPVAFGPPPVQRGQAAPAAGYQPMAPRPATQVWSPAAPDESLSPEDLTAWGAYGSPGQNPGH